jgi:5'-nucleotidase
LPDVRILVTNDDGIDSIGLHVLARAMRPFGDVVVAAPDREYSGSGAALGALHLLNPEVHEASIDGVDVAWSVTGAPALCVMFARLGLFGDPFDLVVAGINPGANVGRSVYHSGTVGACLTARNGGVSGVAVSQAVEHFGIEGQGWDEVLENQRWDTAGMVAAAVVGGLVAELPESAEILNINVPNAPIDELKGWRRTEVGTIPPRSMGTAHRHPKEGHQGAYRIEMEWGEPVELPEHLDGGAVMAGWVSVSCLGRIEAVESRCPGVKRAEAALDELVG